MPGLIGGSLARRRICSGLLWRIYAVGIGPPVAVSPSMVIWRMY